jgi:hypothetical protein
MWLCLPPGFTLFSGSAYSTLKMRAMFLRKVGWLSTDYAALYHRRYYSWAISFVPCYSLLLAEAMPNIVCYSLYTTERSGITILQQSVIIREFSTKLNVASWHQSSMSNFPSHKSIQKQRSVLKVDEPVDSNLTLYGSGRFNVLKVVFQDIPHNSKISTDTIIV